MKDSYLEVTFRHGRLLAAYLYLPQPTDKSYRTARVQPGLVIDFNRGGRPIGIEITAPARAGAELRPVEAAASGNGEALPATRAVTELSAPEQKRKSLAA